MISALNFSIGPAAMLLFSVKHSVKGQNVMGQVKPKQTSLVWSLCTTTCLDDRRSLVYNQYVFKDLVTPAFQMSKCCDITSYQGHDEWIHSQGSDM